MALPRSLAGNRLVMIDSVAGMISAPPMPMKARVLMRAPDEVTRADATEPIPNRIRPTCSAPRRP